MTILSVGRARIGPTPLLAWSSAFQFFVFLSQASRKAEVVSAFAPASHSPSEEFGSLGAALILFFFLLFFPSHCTRGRHLVFEHTKVAYPQKIHKNRSGHRVVCSIAICLPLVFTVFVRCGKIPRRRPKACLETPNNNKRTLGHPLH